MLKLKFLCYVDHSDALLARNLPICFPRLNWTPSVTAMLFWPEICRFYVHKNAALFFEQHRSQRCFSAQKFANFMCTKMLSKVELGFWAEVGSTMHVDALLARNLLVLCSQGLEPKMNFVSRQPACFFFFFKICYLSDLFPLYVESVRCADMSALPSAWLNFIF